MRMRRPRISKNRRHIKSLALESCYQRLFQLSYSQWLFFYTFVTTSGVAQIGICHPCYCQAERVEQVSWWQLVVCRKQCMLPFCFILYVEHLLFTLSKIGNLMSMISHESLSKLAELNACYGYNSACQHSRSLLMKAVSACWLSGIIWKLFLEALRLNHWSFVHIFDNIWLLIDIV